MAKWMVYYVDEARAPEEWVSLAQELESMKFKPVQLHTPEDTAGILEGLCEEYGSAVVVKLLGDFYAIPNTGIIMMSEEPKRGDSDDTELTTVKDLVVERLKAGDTDILITGKKGFENFARDLWTGEIKLPEPWWKNRLKVLALTLILAAPIIYFNVELPKLSVAQRFALKLALLVILLIAGIRRGYLK